MKRLATLLLALVMVFSLVACGGADKGGSDYKIGIITGTASQGEEEIMAAQNMIAKYGEDKIVHATYPDNFSTETEQLIATATNMAADPDVKAIVWVQAVPGATAAINKIKETRDDMLFICGVPGEDPAVIASAADIVLMADEHTQGTAIIEEAARMGAKTFVHISFERHLGYATIAARQQLFKDNCARLGLEYVEATAPDPTGDAGVTGAQGWITQNIKTYVDKYGKDTAFFCTNCSMQDPLIVQVAELGAIYPQQCCPSPYHAYPGAFGIDMAGHEGDHQYLKDQITAKVAEYGNTGRMGTWPVAINMTMIEAGVAYAMKWVEGEIKERNDIAALTKEMEAIAGEGQMTISNWQEADGPIENFYMLFCPFYVF